MEPSADTGRDARRAAMRDHWLARARAELDPARHLVRQGGAYRPASSLPLAQALLASRDPADAREAAAIVGAVLDSQELDERHPHRGNFLWLAGDAEVVDLNAVQFVLRGLLPILVRHGDRLPPELVERCRAAVVLALDEEERLDVAPTYTNIHLMSLLGLVVGGEWLGTARRLALGRERWARWVRFTATSGAVHEYNSPNYAAVDLGALAEIAALARDRLVRFQARLFYERVFLHVALHLHRPTGQQCGPHCRCYWGPMTTGLGPVKELLWLATGWEWLAQPGPFGGERPAMPGSLELALTDHWLPEAVRGWLEHQARALPCEVRETTDAAEGADAVHYLAPGYALGTANRTYGIGQDDFYIEHQANHLILHYARPDGWGMAYSRYVVNDQHWGTKAAAPDRSKQANFYDFGNFAGAQLRNKAIGLYALQPQAEEVSSLKALVAFPRAALLDEVWLDGRRVAPAELPVSVEAGSWLVVVDGAVRVGVRALEPSRLGRDAPVVLERGPQGELWLTAYNYRGAPKRFWEYASLRGAFWRGNLRAGFVVEVAGREEHPSTAAFLAHLREAAVEDVVDEGTVRTVRYRSGRDELELRYDLWKTEPLERRFDGELYRPPMLASPIAVQGADGRLAVGAAALATAPQPVWLIASELDPADRAWAAVNPEDVPTPLRLETPLGVVSAEKWRVGRLELHERDRTLVVDALEEPAGLRVPEGVTVRRIERSR